MPTPTETTDVPATVRSVFSSVLVGIDGSPEALEAARQAGLFAEGKITLLAAWTDQPPLVIPQGSVPGSESDRLRLHAERSLEEAAGASERLAGCSTRAVHGYGWQSLLAEIEREGHTLVAVGSHERSRALGILAGSTATELIHKAPCSVLVARPMHRAAPKRIVVGVDGSPQSAEAHAVAAALAERIGAELWPVVAHGGSGVDSERVAQIVSRRHEDLLDEPVVGLLAAAADADLLVVGSRGLHGLGSIGSVSERVAHSARCSTLIVRGS